MQEEEELLESSVGLLAQILRFTTPEQRQRGLQDANVTENNVSLRIFSVLEKYRHPVIKVSGIRRFSLELAILLMKSDPENVLTFKRKGMKAQMQNVLETTSELENFQIIDGGVGMSRQPETVASLALMAMSLLSE